MSTIFKTLSLFLCCQLTWALEPAVVPSTTPETTLGQSNTTPSNATMATEEPAAKPLTAEQIAAAKVEQDAKIKALVKDQAGRLKQLEQANLDALTQNQELQLKNDNLLVQVQVLQSERSAQMFIYGGVTLGAGVLLGFLISSYIHTKRRRQW